MSYPNTFPFIFPRAVASTQNSKCPLELHHVASCIGGLTADQVTLLVRVDIGLSRYDSTVDPQAWPSCLKNASRPAVILLAVPRAKANRAKRARACSPNPNEPFEPSAINIHVKSLTDQTTHLMSRRIPPDQFRLLYENKELEDERSLHSYWIGQDSILHMILRLRGEKPVIYILPPKPMNVTVKLSLSPQWNFSAIYPAADIVKNDGKQQVEWVVSATPDETLKHNDTETPYLFWEAVTVPVLESSAPFPSASFNPTQPRLGPDDSVVLAKTAVPAYLDHELTKLGLDLRARADFITYWLGHINRNSHIALRFLPQDEYSQAAPLDTVPAAQAMTRVFMLFCGIEEEVLDTWAGSALANSINWASIVGIDPRMTDTSLLRVLEWGGMEVR